MKNSIIFYVTDAPASARFYARLLGQDPVEASPTFAFFALPSGLGLGLWGRGGVDPKPTGQGGACDLGFKVDTDDAVDATCTEWRARGATILLEPADLDFGRSFVATDPDGHWLRVYTVRT